VLQCVAQTTRVNFKAHKAVNLQSFITRVYWNVLSESYHVALPPCVVHASTKRSSKYQQSSI